MAREVKIVVKNVYAPAELQQFIVEETALVKQLKQLVAEQFPGNPLPAHQKLIFGGKICADSDPLQKILNVVRIHGFNALWLNNVCVCRRLFILCIGRRIANVPCVSLCVEWCRTRCRARSARKKPRRSCSICS